MEQDSYEQFYDGRDTCVLGHLSYQLSLKQQREREHMTVTIFRRKKNDPDDVDGDDDDDHDVGHGIHTMDNKQI